MSRSWGEKMIINLAETSGGKPKISYTGTHSTSNITTGGVAYTMYTITGSGTLTVKGKAKNARVWMCGGGASGATGGYSGGGLGGGGAFCAQYDSQKLSGTYTIAIAGGGGNSSISAKGNVVFSANGATGANGGTGGGGTRGEGGTGDGVAKYPFGDSTSFRCHCAGGGGGSGYYETRYDPDNCTDHGQGCYGGAGGSNGGSGGRGSSSNAYIGSTYTSSAGGQVGGGNGGAKSTGTSATFYGSGGGGGGVEGHTNYDYPYTGKNTCYNGGAGYQGVVYLLIPVA